VLDADIDKRVAAELDKRGRTCVSVYTIGFSRLEDPDLLDALDQRYERENWVLFTADDRMPFEHAEDVARVGVAIATVDPRRADGYVGTRQWRREIVHRWAHKAQDQPHGEIRRYSLNSNQMWKPRKHYRMPFAA
jgi:hypothetical protein